MRNAISEALYECAVNDEKICVVAADISPAGSMELLRKSAPERFINTGVAEQAMIGLAAGLALAGYRPFCYTIAAFSLFRPLEMIRVDLCFQDLPVTVVGMGAGIVYSTLGPTHHTTEDITIAKAIPNFRILCPCDPLETRELTKWLALEAKGPTYLRIGKAGEATLTENAAEKLTVGKIRYIVKKDSRVAIISYGPILATAIQLAELLHANDGINSSVISCHTLSPLDENGLCEMLKAHDCVVCIEEAIKYGGLGDSLKILAYERNYNTEIYSYALPRSFIREYGGYDQLLDIHHLSVDKIYSSLRDALQNI